MGKIGPAEFNEDYMKLCHDQAKENKVITFIPVTLSKVMKDNILTHMNPCVLSIRGNVANMGQRIDIGNGDSRRVSCCTLVSHRRCSFKAPNILVQLARLICLLVKGITMLLYFSQVLIFVCILRHVTSKTYK